jgi:hypothetical protein
MVIEFVKGNAVLNLKNLILTLLFLFIISCGNYDKGYEDGYNNSQKKKWIVFGKTEYYNGYLEGAFDAWCKALQDTDYKQYVKKCIEKQE